VWSIYVDLGIHGLHIHCCALSTISARSAWTHCGVLLHRVGNETYSNVKPYQKFKVNEPAPLTIPLHFDISGWQPQLMAFA
jgi:hypothetical protein